MAPRWLQRAAWLRRHRDGDRLDLVERAAVVDAVAEVGERAEEAGGAQRLRPHQRAARRAAELEAGPEDRDVAAGVGGSGGAPAPA